MSAFDSLVLRIDEVEKEDNKVDTTLYILYDHVNAEYLIRGSRRGAFNPYSFVCESQNDTCRFVESVVGIQNKVSYTLINYNDLPMDANEITYDYLDEEFDIRHNEVVGYDKLKLKYNDKFLNRYLRMIRVVFNHYA